MKTHQTCLVSLALVSSFILQPSSMLGQGSLSPPGAPAPTMKTLAQIEPRTPISALPFTITNAGSYYLTTNLTGLSGTNGITVKVSDVTLDLSGFTLTGVSGSLDGVHVTTNLARVAVRNGVIRGWGGRGLEADRCDGCMFERLRISGSGSWGLVSGYRSTVKDCTAINNPGGGITADEHSLVTGCLSAGNDGNGFWFPNSATVRDCVAKNNGGDGVSGGDVSTITGCTSRDNGGAGFVLGYGSAISGCTATANGQTGIGVGMSSVVKDCAVRNSGNGGIVADSGSTISGCALVGNDGPAAIQVQAGCSVLNNTCFGQNDPGQDTPGIRAQSTGSRIEGNNVCSNWWGIVVEGTGNFVFRNTATANSSGNYANAPGNVVGQILNVSGGATITNASPWANFSF